jgi:hypothetical protein
VCPFVSQEERTKMYVTSYATFCVCCTGHHQSKMFRVQKISCPEEGDSPHAVGCFFQFRKGKITPACGGRLGSESRAEHQTNACRPGKEETK